VSSRILVAKCGIDKHDRGAIIVSRALRDAGYEVIYIPSGYTPAELARVAIDEDVDAAGISLHSGAHLSIFSEFVPLVRDGSSRRIAIFAGGTIPPRDIAELHRLGVDEVFTAGTTLVDLAERVGRQLRAADSL
jgi:methylmalonyl-CoA mutase C-terminal domain/subunit